MKPNLTCRFLVCPDDSGQLIEYSNSFQCEFCKRIYKKWADNVFEILPSNCFKFSTGGDKSLKDYNNCYHQLFSADMSFSPSNKIFGWGEFNNTTPIGYKMFVQNEISLFEKIILESPNNLAVDISGGSGNYTLKLAPYVRKMVHLDLDVKSINGAYFKARQRKYENIVFIRADYLQMPFASDTFELVIGSDCLERGKAHESRLLLEIFRILKTGGKAIVDFHQKRSFIKNKQIEEYTQIEVEKLLKSLQINKFHIIPFGWVPSKLVYFSLLYSPLDSLLKFFIKSKRLVVIFEK